MKQKIYNQLIIIGCIVAGILITLPCISVKADTESPTYTKDGIVYSIADTSALVTDVTDMNITSVKIPETITYNGQSYPVKIIGRSAFASCDNLKKVELPDSIISFNMFAFTGCDNLSDINMPAHLRSIAYSAFGNCDNLKKITLPDELSSIGQFAFYGTGLETLTIPKTVTTISASAFCQCESLKEVTFEEGACSDLGEEVFARCDNLEKITLSGNIKKIPEKAFYNCVRLKQINIPDGITEIEDNAFLGCSGLQKISLPRSVTKIREGCFEGTALKELILPEGMQIVGDMQGTISVIYCPQSVESQILSENKNQKVTMLISYTVNADGTVSLAVKKNGNNGNTRLDTLNLPSEISGRRISSISYSANDGIKNIVCSQHYSTGYRAGTQDTHTSICSVCKKDFSEPHTLKNGVCTECGYIPFTLTTEKKSLTLEQGYAADTVLSVTATPTIGTETITYQWYENGVAIAGANANTYTIPVGKDAGTYTYYCKVSSSDYLADGEITSVTIKAKDVNGHAMVDPQKQSLNKGDYFEDTQTNAVYRVLKTGKKGTIAYVRPIQAADKIAIPAAVKATNTTYKVVAIDSDALKDQVQITTLDIGKNVTTIGSNAVSGCKKLKNITIRTSKLTKKSIGKNAFSQTPKKVFVKVPKKKQKVYRSILLKRGMNKKAKWKKI